MYLRQPRLEYGAPMCRHFRQPRFGIERHIGEIPCEFSKVHGQISGTSSKMALKSAGTSVLRIRVSAVANISLNSFEIFGLYQNLD